jgi:hypothetical protein
VKNHGAIFGERQETHLFPKTYKLNLESTEPDIRWVLESLCLKLKRSMHKKEQSQPRSVKINNKWNYCSIDSYIFEKFTAQN